MSVDLELVYEPKFETNQYKDKKTQEDSNNLIVQALFRTYNTCKSFGLVKRKPSVSLTELFTDFSLFKSYFLVYIHDIIAGDLGKIGMYFKLEDIADKSWNGPFTTDFTHFYYGETDTQKVPHGFGILISLTSIYEGWFSNGKFDNKGRMIDSKYGVYDGDWHLGMKNGNGTMNYRDGSKYSGNWRNDLKHGQGIFDEQDSHYEGNFENDVINGYGEKSFRNQKCLYKGNFVNGNFEGFGVLINKGEIETYEGEFRKGLFHGKGTLLMRDQCAYIGNFAFGKKSGFGVIQNSTYRYENEWRNDEPFGEYNYYSNKKYVLKGVWHKFDTKNHMDEVVKDLFLGNYIAATNEKWLREVGIRYIVRVLDNEIVDLLPGFTYFFIKAKDRKTQNITQYLPEAIEFINNSLGKNQKVLVHCYAGASRSSAIVLAYIMKEFGKSFEEAYQYLKTKRNFICPNKGFIKQLKELDFKKKVN